MVPSIDIIFHVQTCFVHLNIERNPNNLQIPYGKEFYGSKKLMAELTQKCNVVYNYNIFHPSLLCHMLMSSRRHDLLEACTGSTAVPFKCILGGNSRRPLFWLGWSTLFLLGNTCHLFETQDGEKPTHIAGVLFCL